MSMVASQPRSERIPPLPPLIVMGVSGCGKSSVGEALAAHFAVPYIEGDAMHPPANIAKMSAGTPLNDDDRRPWLDALAARLKVEAAQNGGAVASCSSLKQAYRDRLQAGAGPQTRFIFLDCSRKTLERNQSQRKGHFMPPSLLDSQLATLEPPHDEARAIVIDGNQPFDAVIQSILDKLKQGA
jgi:gluconokinase